jgi:hypothetical protein
LALWPVSGVKTNKDDRRAILSQIHNFLEYLINVKKKNEMNLSDGVDNI